MMDAQTLRLRNNFILLRNGGKYFDTIVKEMEGKKYLDSLFL